MIGYLKHNNDGWYEVLTNKGMKEPLPEYLKVKLINTKDKRDYFKVMEGLYFGRIFSVARKNNISCITPGTLHKGSVELIFYRHTDKLEIKGLGTFNAYTFLLNRIPLGNYDIEIPDAPHSHGRRYLDRAIYAQTWFRIGNIGDRYLHCGMVSAGCVTVTDVSDWDKIYKYLIISRKNIHSVGEIKVIDK